MPLFESEKDKQLRAKIYAEEKAKFDKKQEAEKEEKIRAQVKANLESGGLTGYLKREAKKFIKESI